jgi:hypothetical protein
MAPAQTRQRHREPVGPRTGQRRRQRADGRRAEKGDARLHRARNWVSTPGLAAIATVQVGLAVLDSLP